MNQNESEWVDYAGLWDWIMAVFTHCHKMGHFSSATIGEASVFFGESPVDVG